MKEFTDLLHFLMHYKSDYKRQRHDIWSGVNGNWGLRKVQDIGHPKEQDGRPLKLDWREDWGIQHSERIPEGRELHG